MKKNDLELFDGYISSCLSPEDTKAFEERLSTDASLKKRFEEYQVIVDGIELAGVNSLKAKLAIQERKYQKTPFKKSLIYKIAAGLIFLVAATFVVNQFVNQANYQELYQEYYTPYPNIIDPVSRASKSNDVSLFQLYEEQKYAEVIRALEEKDLSTEERFYLSQTYMAAGRFNEAFKEAEKITDSSRFYAPAQWYMALIHLNAKDTSSLKKQLDVIISRNGDYKKRAIDLKENL
ncbi:MAG: hypothetical protein AAF843_01955 [Bacteroidota bacterium]